MSLNDALLHPQLIADDMLQKWAQVKIFFFPFCRCWRIVTFVTTRFSYDNISFAFILFPLDGFLKINLDNRFFRSFQTVFFSFQREVTRDKREDHWLIWQMYISSPDPPLSRLFAKFLSFSGTEDSTASQTVTLLITASNDYFLLLKHSLKFSHSPPY